MDKIKLVLIDELVEAEGGGLFIPDDFFFDSIVQLNGLTYVVLVQPSEFGGVCGCVEPEVGGNLGVAEDVPAEFLF